MNETPLPITVRARTTAGPVRRAIRVVSAGSSAATSCPSASTARQPKAVQRRSGGGPVALAADRVPPVVADPGDGVRGRVGGGEHPPPPALPLVALGVAEQHEPPRRRAPPLQRVGDPAGDREPLAERPRGHLHPG